MKGPVWKFVTNGNNVACLGTFLTVDRDQLRRYLAMYPVHWVEA